MNAPAGHHVFLAVPEALLRAGGAAQAKRLLDETDHAHVARFRFAADRDNALASRLLQRLAIARVADMPQEDASSLRFSCVPGERPTLVQPAPLRHLHFSAANTRGLVACAVSDTGVVGLDVEEVKPALAPELLEHCCTRIEREAMQRIPADQRRQAFFRLWTLKESYLKARGIGLQISPHLIGFDTDPADGTIALHADPAVEPNPGNWHFSVLEAGNHHAAALCACQQTDPAPAITNWHAEWDGTDFVFASPAP